MPLDAYPLSNCEINPVNDLSYSNGAATELMITGAPGENGATGAGYGGTSVTSLTIGTGSKTVTTQAGMAYVVGASRVRLASDDGTKIMEGVVTAYSGTSLTFLSDAYAGSGTHDDWNLSITGHSPGGNLPLVYSANGLNTLATGTEWDATNKRLTITSPDNTLSTYGTLVIDKGTGSSAAIDVRYRGQGKFLRFYDSDASWLARNPATYIGNGAELSTQKWVIISGNTSGAGDGFVHNPPRDAGVYPQMLGIWSDVAHGLMVRTYNAAGGYMFSGLDRQGDFRLLIPESGALQWCADGNQTISPDVSFSRYAAATMSVGSGAEGSDAGHLRLRTLYHSNEASPMFQRVEAYSTGLNVHTDYRINRNSGTGLGGETYYNEEFFFGANIGTSPGARLNASVVASERYSALKVWDGTRYNVAHRESYIDSSGTNRIPFQWMGSYDGTSVAVTYTGTRVTYQNVDASAVAVQFQPGLSSGTVNMGSFTYVNSFLFGFNNSAWGQQRNAANSTYLALPYIGAGNELKIAQPVQAIFGRPATGATYTNAFFVIQPSGALSGDYLFYLPGPSVTGTLNTEVSASPSGLFNMAWYNNANNSGAHVRHELRTIGGSAGDPYMLMHINGGGAWSIGVKNNASDRLEFCNGVGLGAAIRMIIDGTNFGFNGLSAGSGTGVLFIANAGAVPTANPTGGGILYCEAGALKYRGSSGTITTLGAA